MSWYTVFSRVINMSLTGGLAILAVVLARLFLKRVPRAVSYGLWAVVLFRLLCPVAISSDASLLGLVNAHVKEAAVGNRLEYISIEALPVANMPGVDQGRTDELSENDDFALNEMKMDTDTADNNVDRQKTVDYTDDQVVVTVEPFVVAEQLIPLAVLWILGIAGMLLYGSLSCRRLRRSLVGAVCLRDNIFLSDYIVSPFIMGLLRPRIYLPSGLGERERSFILLHEQYHIRRLDHVAKMAAFLALCIHWFNPLVWLAFILFEKDMEMSCDEAVVKRMGEEVRADYSALLLGLATGRRGIAGMPLAFGEGDPSGRIRNLAKWKRPALGAVIVAVAGCVVLAVGLLTNPREAEQETETVAKSLTCNVKSRGINTDIDPSYFPEDFDFNYDGLMRCVVMGDGVLTFDAGWAPQELVVGESYYEVHSVGTLIMQDTHRLRPNEQGKYTLTISHRKKTEEEKAFYFIKGENGKYVLEVQFPAEERDNKRQKEDEEVESLDAIVFSTVGGKVKVEECYYIGRSEVFPEEEDTNETFFYDFDR